jgi:autoinducer 2-degrading protein
MYGAFMKLHVKTGMRSELLEFLRWDADEAKRREPGTLRFDVWQVEGEPRTLYLYEAYKDEQAFDSHKEGERYKQWEDVVRTMMEREPEYVIPFAASLVSNVTSE